MLKRKTLPKSTAKAKAASVAAKPSAAPEVKETVATINKAIRRHHRKAERKAWRQLSSAEKRVLIAKDVLKFLNNGEFTALRGRYLTPKNDSMGNYQEALQQSLQVGNRCNVCAIGATFVACARREGEGDGDLKPYSRAVSDSYGMTAAVEKSGVFSQHTLRMMERVFEHHLTSARSSEGALREIMRHIIEHKGKFDETKFGA